MKWIDNKLTCEAGDSKIAGFLLFIALLIIVLLAWKVGVPVVKNMMLSSFVQKEVNYDRENFQLDATMLRRISESVYNKSKSLKLPVGEKDIKVDQEGDRAIIEIKYKYPVDLFVLKFDKNFNIYRKSEGVGFKLDQ